MYFFVMLAKAEIQLYQLVATTMDSGFHDSTVFDPEAQTRRELVEVRSDDFLRDSQTWSIGI